MKNLREMVTAIAVLIALSGTTSRAADWNALGSGVGGGGSPTIYALTIDKFGNLYAGGYFSSAGGNAANNIAKWNGSVWSPLGTGANYYVNSLAADSTGNVYAGGLFTGVGGVSAGGFAKWDGTIWSALNGNFDGSVRSIIIDTLGNIYAGGEFSSVSSIPAKNIAKWNGSQWISVGAGLNSWVNSLACSNSGDLVACGAFTVAGGIVAVHAAQWDGVAWHALGIGVDSTIYSCIRDNANNLIAGGSSSKGGFIAKWNGTGWVRYGNAVSNEVDALACDGANYLYAGYQGSVSQWNGTVSSQLGNIAASYGISSINSLAYDPPSGNLYVGGGFTSAGGKSASSIAVVHVCAPSGPPHTPQLLSPANGIGGQASSIILSWNQLTGGTSFLAQVSTSSAFSNIAFQDSTITATSKLVGTFAAGPVYYWRLRGKNGIGSGPWSAVWSFMVAGAPPAVPALLSPANGSTSQQSSLTLSWSTAGDASSYRAQVSTTVDFSVTIIDDAQLPIAQKAVSSLPSGATCYWRVSAANSAGSSTWSAVWSFTIVNLPQAPVLSFPINNSSDQLRSLALTWNTVAGATSYFAQLSQNAGFSAIVAQDSALSGTQFSISLAPGMNYFWRVRCRNAVGVSTWSAVWSFTTGLDAPALLSPGNGAQHQPALANLAWSPANGATSYRVQIATNSGFGAVVMDSSTASAMKNAALSLGTTYFWRIMASNSGGSSAWSSIWTFTTAANPPPAPALVSPANGMAGVAKTVTFSWASVAGAAKYELQISNGTAFATIFADDSSLTSLSSTISGFTLDTRYYWRVRAIAANGDVGSFSPTWVVLVGFTPVASAKGAHPTELNVATQGSVIRYSLPEAGQVSIRLYTLQGRTASILYCGQQKGGEYSLRPASLGVVRGSYILELRAGSKKLVKKVAVFN